MAVGSRAHLQAAATAKRSWYRNLLMRGFHLLVVLVAGSSVKDTQCGFKVCPHPVPSLTPCSVTLHAVYVPTVSACIAETLAL